MRESDHLEYHLPGGWTVVVVGIRRQQRGVIAEAILRNGTIRHHGSLTLSDPAGYVEWLDAAAAIDGGPPRGSLEEVFQQRAYPNALDLLLQEDSPPNGGLSESIVALIPQSDLLHDGRRGYAIVPFGDRQETLPITGSTFRAYLARLCHVELHATPSREALGAAINVLEGMATFDGPERRVFTRTAEHDGGMYLDLADELGHVAHVTRAGWHIVTSPPVLFLRPAGMKALPVPVRGGALADLRRFVNVPQGDGALTLILGWLLGAIRPVGPYPLLILTGEEGSAKTTAAAFLRALVDPNMAPVRTLPRKEEDLVIAATRSQLLAFDNLSRMSEEMSDTLCRLATGGGLGKRRLYTDEDETILDAQRPVILTSIEDVATRSDLLDRAIVLQLPRISEESRRPERALRADFEEARPRLLGALLDAASTALRNLPGTQLDTWPRMADFAQWVVAAEPALPVPAGAFLDAYTGNRTEAREAALEAYPIAGLVREVAEACACRSPDHWQGSATELLAELEKRADEATRQARSWPKAPNALSGQLRRLQGSLRAVGIAATRDRHNVGSQWTLQKIVTDRHAATGGVPAPFSGDDRGDDVTIGDDLSGGIVTAEPCSDAENADVTIGDDLLQSPAGSGICPSCGGGVTELPDGDVVCDVCERVVRHA